MIGQQGEDLELLVRNGRTVVEIETSKTGIERRSEKGNEKGIESERRSESGKETGTEIEQRTEKVTLGLPGEAAERENENGTKTRVERGVSTPLTLRQGEGQDRQVPSNVRRGIETEDMVAKGNESAIETRDWNGRRGTKSRKVQGTNAKGTKIEREREIGKKGETAAGHPIDTPATGLATLRALGRVRGVRKKRRLRVGLESLSQQDVPGKRKNGREQRAKRRRSDNEKATASGRNNERKRGKHENRRITATGTGGEMARAVVMSPLRQSLRLAMVFHRSQDQSLLLQPRAARQVRPLRSRFRPVLPGTDFDRRLRCESLVQVLLTRRDRQRLNPVPLLELPLVVPLLDCPIGPAGDDQVRDRRPQSEMLVRALCIPRKDREGLPLEHLDQIQTPLLRRPPNLSRRPLLRRRRRDPST